MLLPKLIEDKIRGYLHPPCVYIFKGSAHYSHYKKIYDYANWKTGVKNFLSEAMKPTYRTNCTEIRIDGFGNLEKIEDFPYHLLTSKNKIKINLRHTYHINKSNSDFWLFMIVEKWILNEKWKIYFDINKNKDKSFSISIFLIQN